MSNHRQGHGRGPPWGPLNRPNPFHHPVFPSSHGSASQFSVPPPITMPLMNLMGFPPPGPMQSNAQVVYVPVPVPYGTSPSTSTQFVVPSIPNSGSTHPFKNKSFNEKSKKRSMGTENNDKNTSKQGRKKTKENPRTVREKQFVSKARTLGELVEETKARNKDSEKEVVDKGMEVVGKLEDVSDDEFQESEMQEITGVDNVSRDGNIREVGEEFPPITAKDYEEDFIDSDQDDFDPTTMSIKDYGLTTHIAPDCSHLYEKMDNGDVKASATVLDMVNRFERDVLSFVREEKHRQPVMERDPTPAFHKNCKCGHDSGESSSDSSLSSDEDGEEMNGDIEKMSDRSRNFHLLRKEVDRKRNHPAAISVDICFNEPGMSNDGPACRCSLKAKEQGLRHNKYAAEKRIDECCMAKNNSGRLFHYILHVNPNPGEGMGKRSTIIHDSDMYELEGYSVFFHRKLPESFPQMPTSRWTADFDFSFQRAPMTHCFIVSELELFHSFVFDHVLELLDVSRRAFGVQDGCPLYHIMPRFINRKGGIRRMLPMYIVLSHLLSSFVSVISESEANRIMAMRDDEFQHWTYKMKHHLIMNPAKRPSTIRIDSLGRNVDAAYPHILHHTIKPPVYANVNNPELQKCTKKLNKLKHLLSMKKSCSPEERKQMDDLQRRIDVLKAEANSLRTATVIISPHGFFRTGLHPDIVTHSLLLLLACQHVRFHWSLQEFENTISYQFRNRTLLELALTHPSHKNNYGTNADHAKNTLMNCGYKRKYSTEEKKEKKKGIQNLLQIMSRGGNSRASVSPVTHNERLEYLGDAVVEMIVTNRLFFMLPHHNEGGLATYRSALVQNRNLASLAKSLRVDEWMLFAHGPDLCHEADFRHAMANAFEALMAAIYLDAGIDHCDRIFSEAMFGDDPEMKKRWDHVNEHQLKLEMPGGDRQMIGSVPALKKLAELEQSIGVQFEHIRVLAKAFTRRTVPHNNLTYGNNQRLEWLGDTVLQLIVSDYLYKHFPYHHEGHLSLLRTCLVSNRTQSLICDDLAMGEYLVRPAGHSRDPELRIKDKADLVEAFIGALFVDRGWQYCNTFVRVCFLPRLKHFISSNRWNDPKSQLQQSCLALRAADSRDPEVPEYRTIAVQGSTNTRRYKVAVYFRKQRLAVGEGGNIHIAQMNAAERALIECTDLFPTFGNKEKFRRVSARHYGPAPLITPSRSSLPSLLSGLQGSGPPAYGVPLTVFSFPSMPSIPFTLPPPQTLSTAPK